MADVRSAMVVFGESTAMSNADSEGLPAKSGCLCVIVNGDDGNYSDAFIGGCPIVKHRDATRSIRTAQAKIKR